MKHIIIAFNPIVDLYIRSLIKSIGNESDISIIEIYNKKIFSQKNREFFNESKNINFHSLLYEKKIDYLNRLKEFKKVIGQMEKDGENPKNINVYFSHPFHMTSNYLFFRKNFTYHLIPDGIANYYDITTSKFLKQMFQKKLLGLLINFNYKPYLGHLIYFNREKYNIIYSLTKKIPILGESKNLKLLDIDLKIRKKMHSKSILILGQPIKNKEKYKIFLLQIKNILSLRFDGFEIFYKPHPSEIISSDFKNFLEQEGFKLENNLHMQDILNKYEIFVSSLSSALFILKLMSPELKVISILKEDMFNLDKKNILLLKKLFTNLGVEIIEVK